MEEGHQCNQLKMICGWRVVIPLLQSTIVMMETLVGVQTTIGEVVVTLGLTIETKKISTTAVEEVTFRRIFQDSFIPHRRIINLHQIAGMRTEVVVAVTEGEEEAGVDEAEEEDTTTIEAFSWIIFLYLLLPAIFIKVCTN